VREKVRGCHFLVVVIGPAWKEILAERMANGQEDVMRLALRAAVQEHKPIVPVCVDEASWPREIDLPFDLRPMLKYPPAFVSEGQQFRENIQWVFDQIDLEEESEATSTVQLTDFEDLYQGFLAAYDAEDWEIALDFLERIEALGEMQRRPFKLQLVQYMRQVKSHIRFEEARPLYEHVMDLADTDPDHAWDAFQLFLAEYPEFGDPQDLEGQLCPIPPEIQHWLVLATDPETEVRVRIGAADQLAELGDPRSGVGLRPDGTPDISWVRVPEGEFIYHYDKRQELPAFYIARYPVTYVQFEAFVEDGGYEDEYWWEGLVKRETEPSLQRWASANHPRLRLSWFDGVAFCRWLSDRLGYEVRLPIEPEWEKAARGTDGRIYSWGDKYIAGCANINEVTSGVGPNNLRKPCPVGIYPKGVSPYGAHDMIGNIWEWCLNSAQDDDVVDVTTNEKRALRGGSWLSEWMFAHSVRRRVQLPDSRFPDFGFRVACSQLPVVTDF
ncbi:MAG: formylglycine-generating enzyme family protein, partial [Chloroflexi bacterium]|nr:formylglycine-generating enzyme family protein [Chloroflexota bacterium]